MAKTATKKKAPVAKKAAAKAKTPVAKKACAKTKTTVKKKGFCELKKTAVLMNFVKAKNGKWNHDEWLELLESLKSKGYVNLDPDQVGLLLEEKKATYLAK